MNLNYPPPQCQWWALHRRLYHWVMHFAKTPQATTALFFISFIEASLFPIAPDLLQIALSLENRSKAWFYAGISTCGSVLGGLLGYLLGAVTWHFTSSFFFKYIFSQAQFNQVHALYNTWGFWAVLTAAFTPIPYKIFTISAGVFHFPLLPFLIASVLGRAARFFLVAGLLNYYGPSIKLFIEKYLNLLTLLLLLLLVGGFLIFQAW